ncbi:MAG: hypothetical protein ACLF0P_08525 [Thermoanaerobaculia bacterium]
MTSPARLALGILLVFAPAAAGPVLRAQEAPPAGSAEPFAVASELQRLNSTLDRIATLLDRQLEGQALDLQLKRLEVASRRVDSLEEDLSRVRSSREGLTDERMRVETHLEHLAVEVEEADSEELPELEVSLRQAQRMMDRLESRTSELDARILALENELTGRRSDLQALEDQLDRELAGLD